MEDGLSSRGRRIVSVSWKMNRVEGRRIAWKVGRLVEDGSSASRERRIAWKGDGSPGQGDLRVGGRAAGRRRTALQQGGVAGLGDARRGVAR